MRKLVVLFIFLVIVGRVQAKDLYVSQFAAGTGTGAAGCSNAAPLSWLNDSTNWGSGATQIGPGTTLHLCGTFTAAPGTNLVTFNGSGSSGSPIILLFEAGTVLQAPYFGALRTAAINTNNNSWLVIDGGPGHGTIRNTANGSGLANQQNSMAISASNCSNCEFRNLTIANMYVHSSASDTTHIFNDGCIYFNGSQSNVSIHDNVLHDAHWCITYTFGKADNNIQIYNNTIYDVDHGIAIAGTYANSTSNVRIYHNHIYSYANWDTGSANAYHHDGIHIYGTGTPQVDSIAIYDNDFGGPVGQNVTGHIFIETGAGASNIAVYNNLFMTDAVVNNGMVDVGSGSNDIVANNTFVGAGAGSGACYRSNNNLTAHTFENNVLVNCNILVSVQNVSFASGNPNHNIYSQGGNLSFQCGTKFFPFSQFTAWQACIAGDANSTYTASAGLSASGVPLSGSVAIGQGANLTSMCTGQLSALCKDKTGNTRPANGSWTAGAYNSGALNPPTGLKLTVVQRGTPLPQ